MRNLLARPVLGTLLVALAAAVVDFGVVLLWNPGPAVGIPFGAVFGGVVGVLGARWSLRIRARRQDAERLARFDASCRALGYEPPGQTIYLGDISPGESRTFVVRKDSGR